MARYIVYSLVFLMLAYACAPKTVKVKKEETYSEDLSGTLPEVERYESPVKEPDKREKLVFSEPEMDVSYKLDSLNDSLAVMNERIPYYKYTVLVHNSSSRKAAEEARNNVYRIMPDASPQMKYNPPSYRVKVGNYFNRIEAYRTLVRLKELFPNAVIVPEQVYPQ